MGKKEKQLALKLKHSFINDIIKLRDQVYKKFEIFELNKYSKDSRVWLTMSSIISILLVTLYEILFKYHQLPSKLPILRIEDTDIATLLQKELLFIYPLVIFALLVVYYKISSTHYEKEKELSLVLSFLIVLISLCLLISLKVII